MTELQEYIITEEMVVCIEAWTKRFPIVSKDIASVIRSRPAKESSDVLDEQITELSDFIHQNAEMVQNKLEDKWSNFDMMIKAIKIELRPYHPAPEATEQEIREHCENTICLDYHSTVQGCQPYKCNYQIAKKQKQMNHDATIRQSERGEVLDELEPICDSCKYLDLLDHCPCEKPIESLRKVE
jgi:hypothetical protein